MTRETVMDICVVELVIHSRDVRVDSSELHVLWSLRILVDLLSQCFGWPDHSLEPTQALTRNLRYVNHDRFLLLLHYLLRVRDPHALQILIYLHLWLLLDRPLLLKVNRPQFRVQQHLRLILILLRQHLPKLLYNDIRLLLLFLLHQTRQIQTPTHPPQLLKILWIVLHQILFLKLPVWDQQLL